MTLPASGAISLSQVNTELGYSSTATISLNDSAVRTLAGVPSGAISMANLQGKSSTFSFTISTNQTNANLRSLAVSAGWNQSSAVVATISSGIYISSNGTGTPALTVNGSFPGGVSLVNNGVIVGMGGAGGAGGGNNYASSAGSSGGLALSVSSTITINNAGTIAGGGGGGGGGAVWQDQIKFGYDTPFGAGGGGGGRSSVAANSSGGAGGNGWGGSYPVTYGGAGGSGTSSGAGGGGSYGVNPGTQSWLGSGPGGSGGDWGAAGSSGGAKTSIIAGRTLYGAAGGGAAGGAVSGNSNITWTATGTRYGGIS